LLFVVHVKTVCFPNSAAFQWDFVSTNLLFHRGCLPPSYVFHQFLLGSALRAFMKLLQKAFPLLLDSSPRNLYLKADRELF
jgi:hypothetical protein